MEDGFGSGSTFSPGRAGGLSIAESDFFSVANSRRGQRFEATLCSEGTVRSVAVTRMAQASNADVHMLLSKWYHSSLW